MRAIALTFSALLATACATSGSTGISTGFGRCDLKGLAGAKPFDAEAKGSVECGAQIPSGSGVVAYIDGVARTCLWPAGLSFEDALDLCRSGGAPAPQQGTE